MGPCAKSTYRPLADLVINSHCKRCAGPPLGPRPAEGGARTPQPSGQPLLPQEARTLRALDCCCSHLQLAVSCAQMGVAGLFFDNLGAVSTSVKLQNLERIGDMSIGALDASIMIHDVACRVDPVATIEGNFTPVALPWSRTRGSGT